VTLTDKVTRAWKLSARYEAGRVYHRARDLQTDALEEQLTGFPRGKHDDMFDALDLAVNLGCVVRARRRREFKVGIFGFGPRKAARVRLSLSR
jgi:phage terminase large subunit-like protein